MSWLINSMQAHIAHSILLLDSANKIWSSAAHTYSQTGNYVRVYDLKKRVHDTIQGEITVAQYFAELNTLWQELDFYQDFRPECPVDTTKFQKWVDKECVFDFLARLTLEYDQTRSQILGRDPFPSLRQAYAYVQKEESRRIAMMLSNTQDRSALVANLTQKAKETMDRDQIKCDHCGKTRHTKETCWKLHGRPIRGRGGKRMGPPRSQAHFSETTEFIPNSNVGHLSKEEVQALKQIMSQLETSSSFVMPSSNFAHSGTSEHAFLTSSPVDSSSWVIDSGTSKHMTGSPYLFSSYVPSSGKDKVRIADGSFSSISGKGSIQCTPNLKLPSILRVPSFPYIIFYPLVQLRKN
ncbi:UBN2_3 domain-containing protein [Cephalotus follicularis]|uniref:UBN2_3 domain-containing protein n=1 Tax=Cephalotus follicularis TaxID=3775 RepID=A0A1Q3BPP9_CEPFO|nr:UBN2_3 domain-containing protein [Cephalotus follicularis]